MSRAAAFTVSHFRKRSFSRRGLRGYFEYRDLGIRRATRGEVVAHVIRAPPARARQSLERLFHEFQEQPLAFVGGGGARKTRARAAVGVGRQGELRDRQQLPADVA